jgi:hypothetical protein
MHNQFEELCAFAISDQISDAERMLLDEHLRVCDDCRSFLDDMRTEAPQLASAMAELMVVPVEPPSGMRQRFLERAAEAGLNVHPGPAVVPHLPSVKSAVPRSPMWAALGWLRSHVTISLPAAAAFATVCVVATYLGLSLKRVRTPEAQLAASRKQPESLVQPLRQTATAQKTDRTALDAAQEDALKKELDAAHAQIKGYAEKQKQLESANDQLSRSLLNETQVSDLRAADLQAQRDAASKQVAALHQQLDEADSKATTLEAVASLQEKLTQDAQQKLAAMRDETDKLYASRGTVESLVASRNLHIIDVYDSSGNGNRQGAFGRVFFVEGKSLVFYAYDLPTSKRQKSVSFQLWGEGQGAEPTTFKLGLMRPDTNGNGRWVVSCDDPNVLKQLRAVYIAPPSSRADPPSQGQRLMYALLGAANHP